MAIIYLCLRLDVGQHCICAESTVLGSQALLNIVDTAERMSQFILIPIPRSNSNHLRLLRKQWLHLNKNTEVKPEVMRVEGLEWLRTVAVANRSELVGWTSDHEGIPCAVLSSLSLANGRMGWLVDQCIVLVMLHCAPNPTP